MPRRLLTLALGMAIAGCGSQAQDDVRSNTSALQRCSVDYEVQNEWPDGATVRVRFDAHETLPTWKLEWTMAGGESIRENGGRLESWNADIARSGAGVVATQDANWHWSPRSVGELGFNIAKPSGAKAQTPGAFRLNGVPCNGAAPPGNGAPADAGTPPSPPPPPPPPAPPTPPSPGSSPVATHGRLHVCGTSLCNERDAVVQLRGISTHGLQWFGKAGTDSQCISDDALAAMRTTWNADIVRLALYVEENGYNDRPYLKDEVKSIVRAASTLGMYALVDWHILTPGNPNDPKYDKAAAFFSEIAGDFKDNKNVLYEIANEPNGVGWPEIKRYAERIIPVIRAKDPASVVIVGTPDYSSFNYGNASSVNEILASPPYDASANQAFGNLMYALHFYAENHDGYQTIVRNFADKIPLFVTEWGVGNYAGNGTADKEATAAWLDLMRDKKVSWCVWNWADKAEATSLFSAGACKRSGWNVSSSSYATSPELKVGGKMIFQALTRGDHDFSRLQ